jgi:hypothetical protein
VVVGFDISGVVCLIPASLVVSGEAPARIRRSSGEVFFNCISTGFSPFLIILLIGVGLSWFLPFFQHCYIQLLRLFICCIFVEECVFGPFVD